MKQFRVLATAFAAALLVAACGGGGDGDQSPAVKYASVVSFGDSLSDAGTYSVGPIKASGGGMFTVNGIASASAVGADPVPSYNWAQLVSAAAIGKTSCAARTGGFGVVESVVAGCTNYAQGGARVVDPKGVGNPVGVGFTAGPLTEPVVTQIANYLADGGSFAGTELVTVLGGANDLFGQTDKLKEDATAEGGKAFVSSLTSQLAAGATTPATAATAISTAFLAAKTAGASDQLAVSAAIQAAAAAGNTNVMDLVYINAAVATATTAATNAVIGGALDGGASAFVASLTGTLAADATTPATAAAAISTAFVSAKAAGASDQLAVSAAVQAAATAGNTKVMNMTFINSTVATATAAAIAAGNTYLATTGAANAMTGMAVAATALANSVKSMITSGAKHVVVVNIPDVSQTPMAMATIVYNTDGSIKDNSQQQLVLALTSQFNTTLQTALEVSPGVAVSGVVFVDAFAENRRQLANKAHYALTNVKDVACNLTSPVNVLATAGKADGSSLVCNAGNLIAGDTSHYLFADNVHPTPYGHKLLAQYVTKALVIAGWL